MLYEVITSIESILKGIQETATGMASIAGGQAHALLTVERGHHLVASVPERRLDADLRGGRITSYNVCYTKLLRVDRRSDRRAPFHTGYLQPAQREEHPRL